jgi:hypothetical protein
VTQSATTTGVGFGWRVSTETGQFIPVATDDGWLPVEDERTPVDAKVLAVGRSGDLGKRKGAAVVEVD